MQFLICTCESNSIQGHIHQEAGGGSFPFLIFQIKLTKFSLIFHGFEKVIKFNLPYDLK